MVHLIATVSPGAKLGSTAPHSYAHMMLAEASNAQPRTLANAFLIPVRTSHDLIAIPTTRWEPISPSSISIWPHRPPRDHTWSKRAALRQCWNPPKCSIH